MLTIDIHGLINDWKPPYGEVTNREINIYESNEKIFYKLEITVDNDKKLYTAFYEHILNEWVGPLYQINKKMLHQSLTDSFNKLY